VRVVQWNISTKSDPGLIAGRLQNYLSLDVVTILCLQEVVRSGLDVLVERLNPSSTAYSLDFRPAGQNEGANRRMGIAILTFGAEIIESGLLDRTVFPERSLWAR